MPVVQVTLTESRGPETTRQLISNLTEAVVGAGVAPKENVRVIIHEIPSDHYAAGDVNLSERSAQSSQRRDQP